MALVERVDERVGKRVFNWKCDSQRSRPVVTCIPRRRGMNWSGTNRVRVFPERLGRRPRNLRFYRLLHGEVGRRNGNTAAAGHFQGRYAATASEILNRKIRFNDRYSRTLSSTWCALDSFPEKKARRSKSPQKNAGRGVSLNPRMPE